MDWDAVSAVCDVLGTLAVVISLLYVARQLRQTAAYSRAATQQTLVSQSVGLVRWVSENPARMETLRKCVDGFEGMTPDEKFTVYGTLTSWLAGLENAAYFREAGICHDAVYRQQERIALMILGTKGGAEFWRYGRHLVGADLATLVDGLLARGDKLPPLEQVMPWVAVPGRAGAAA
ncbi:MAG: hypothetical protein AB7O49_12035 [Sphingomonadales bacterium]